MPRTVDHIVATHQLAAERRRQGQPVWAETLDVSDVFHDHALSFEERRDATVERIKATRWYRNADPTEFDGVKEIADHHLAYAEDVDEFDAWWDELYDLADFERIWIKTR